MRKTKDLIENPKPDLEDVGPKSKNTKPGLDKIMDRMRKVDPEQSEKYKQRTGE